MSEDFFHAVTVNEYWGLQAPKRTMNI